MLVLSRENGQKLFLFVPGLEQPIVIESRGTARASIGITAGPEVTILREEVYEQRLAEAREAGQPLTFRERRV